MNQNSSLFLGRFQPFHLGHLDAIFQIFKKFPDDFLLIGIGSATESFQPKNPFTASERTEMIFAALDEAGISREKYNIFPIPDINNYALYPAHVQKLLPSFSRIFSGSSLLRQLFLENSDQEVFSLEDRKKISATLVREKIKKGEELNNFLPPAVIHFLQEKKAQERLLKIEKSNFEL